MYEKKYENQQQFMRYTDTIKLKILQNSIIMNINNIHKYTQPIRWTFKKKSIAVLTLMRQIVSE